MTLRATLAAIITCLALASCGGDGDGGPPADATGTWNTTITYGAGNCNAPGAVTQEIFSVTKSTNGYLVSNSNPEQGFTGTIACSSSECKLSGMWIESGGNASINATVDKSGKISGTGSISKTGLDPATGEDATCNQAFTVSGTKS